jgi:MFS family permease
MPPSQVTGNLKISYFRRNLTGRVAAPALYFILALAIALAFQYWNGSYHVDLGMTGDEAAHFVNSMVIRDYLTQGLGSNPLDFARQYYAHLPRVSIGHWPPFFYLVDALLVALWDRSIQAAIVFQAVILAALSACTGAMAGRRYGFIAGGGAALAMLLAPIPLYLVNAVMIDNFMALVMLLAALAWARYAQSRRLFWCCGFALVSSAAILTKGSGFALALVPLLYAGLSGKWRLLIAGRIWLAASIVAVLTLPWTLLTMRFVADGFNFQPGLAYSTLAVERYGAALGPTFGYAVLVAFIFGAGAILRESRRDKTNTYAPPIETSLLALALAVIIFQIAAPADIAPRYLIPSIAPVLLISLRGVAAACALFRITGKWPLTAGIYAVLALNAAQTFRAPRVGSHLMDRVAEEIVASNGDNPLILAAASPNGEGALIAEFAALDPNRRNYVVRGTKLLASGDFMGANYTLQYSTDEAAAKAIAADRFGWIVIELGRESEVWPHVSQVLRSAARQPAWQRIAFYQGYGRAVLLYRVEGPLPSAEDIKRTAGIVALDEKLLGN